tara:strand:+ start:3392 stop:4132 length:741 start_codon:yes stop_codon:yes gene_type:complete
MSTPKTLVDKTYRLKRGMAPLSFMLPSRNSHRHPLLHFDGTSNRALRYSPNQKTPFEDEQDKQVILEPIIFEDGFLRVPKTNPVLQYFLEIHPENGKVFEEINNERDAEKELETFNYEVDALIAAKQLDLVELERIGRVVLGKNVTKMSTAELRRDVLVYARKDPKEFLSILNDPMTNVKATIALMFDKGLLGYRGGKDVHFNLPTNKKRMLTVPYGEDRDYIVASYMQSDEGLESFKLLEPMLED